MEIPKLTDRLSHKLPGFVERHQLLFIAPPGDLLRGIYLDRSINPRRFYIQVFIQPMFVPAENLVFTFDWRLGGGSHTWDLDSSSLLPDLSASIKRAAIPYLSTFESVRAFTDIVLKDKRTDNPHVQQVIALALTRDGRGQEASPILNGLSVEFASDPIPWKREIADRAKFLKTGVDSGPQKAQGILDAWKSATVKSLKLDTLC